MKCFYCEAKFRLTKTHTDRSTCPDCLGTDTASVDAIDAEAELDLQLLQNPSGRTAAVLYDD